MIKLDSRLKRRQRPFIILGVLILACVMATATGAVVLYAWLRAEPDPASPGYAGTTDASQPGADPPTAAVGGTPLPEVATGEVGSTPPVEGEAATVVPSNPDNQEQEKHPYISGIGPRTYEIFLRGQQLGNRPAVFSKVGDSITASPVFLVPIGTGDYNLRSYTYLQPVIDFYSQEIARDHNSFANTSLAAGVGWSVWHMFDPDSADSLYCLPDEGPLACEYRVVRPAVALIMLGTNDVMTMPTQVYERYMRRVIETSLDMGVIPVVSTIPDFTYEDVGTKVQRMNEVIIALAQEYEIPLLDYWASLQELPNRGLSTDGIHPSWAVPADFAPNQLRYGMTRRNLTALQCLDAVWQAVIR